MGRNSKYYGIPFDRRSQNFGFHMIARSQLIANDRRTFCDLRSAIVCDHMETTLKMPGSVKTLRRENDDLKKQLQQLTKDFESMEAKMAERNGAIAASLPNQDDVQFLSDSYDNLVQSKDDIAQHEIR